MQSAVHQTSYIQQNTNKIPLISKNGLVFVVFALLWQIAAVILYGFFIGYDETLLNQNSPTTTNAYMNIYVIMALFLFIVVGFTLMSTYVTSSSAINMTFTILLILLTLQNWFIYRLLFYKSGLSRDPLHNTFQIGPKFDQVSFLPTNTIRTTSDNYGTASFYQAIGACIAMFCALTPVLGRIGFVELFFLSWLGPFTYEINSSIFNRFFIVDNGFGMRGFLFGGFLGLIISLTIGKHQQSIKHLRFKSYYHTQSLAFIGAIIVCLTYPTVVSTGLLTLPSLVPSLAGVVQINSWLSLAGSIIGSYAACSILYAKLCVHNIIFTTLSGAIAFSSSTVINYNPGAAIAIGSGVGFLCALLHSRLKKWVNQDGIRQSNSVFVQFVIPGVFACVMSSILQAIGESAISSANVPEMRNMGRSVSEQAGWQLMGFVFSFGSALLCGLVLGLISRFAHDTNTQLYFNDKRFIQLNTKDIVQERERTVTRSRSNI